MSKEIERKIIMFCNKGKMDINNLKISKNEEGYVADDGHLSMLFNERGTPISLPMNKTYSSLGPKFGKRVSIVYLALIIGLILFCAIEVHEILVYQYFFH